MQTAIYYTARHFVDGTGTFKELQDGIRRLQKAAEISQTATQNICFGLNVTVDENLPGEQQQQGVKTLLSELPPSVGHSYHAKNRGAGGALKQVLFDAKFVDEPAIAICADLDQFIFETEDGFGRIWELARRTEDASALFAVGARDVPVHLGTNISSTRLRAIDEHYKALALGENASAVSTPQQIQSSPAFSHFGESVSGCYVINTAHPRYGELKRSVEAASRSTGLTACAADAYIALKAASLAPVVRGYVRSKPNKFYAQKEEERELKDSATTLYEQARVLGATDVAGQLLAAIDDKMNKKRLERFYPSAYVAAARKLVGAGLRGGQMPPMYFAHAAKYAQRPVALTAANTS